LLVGFSRHRLGWFHLFEHIRDHTIVLKYGGLLFASKERRQLPHAPQQESPHVTVGEKAKPSLHKAPVEDRKRGDGGQAPFHPVGCVYLHQLGGQVTESVSLDLVSGEDLHELGFFGGCTPWARGIPPLGSIIPREVSEKL
jgi:hypothetical protein